VQSNEGETSLKCVRRGRLNYPPYPMAIPVEPSCAISNASIHHRLRPYIQARLASMVAMFNVMLTLIHQLHINADPFQMSIAEFSL
jgi:hypothetical protein